MALIDQTTRAGRHCRDRLRAARHQPHRAPQPGQGRPTFAVSLLSAVAERVRQHGRQLQLE